VLKVGVQQRENRGAPNMAETAAIELRYYKLPARTNVLLSVYIQIENTVIVNKRNAYF
jgi:hypothetical protein